jgi:phage-related protein
MSKPITISIVGNAGPLKKSLREADDAMASFGEGLKKFGLAAAAGVGTLAAGIGFAAKAAAEDQQSFAQLETALRNVTGATHDQIKAVDDQIAAMSLATGVADDQLRPAFAALTRGTRDIAESTEQMGLVLDISTALQMDATTVADALAKGYEGNTKALKSLSPEMAAMIKEGAGMDEILSQLSANFGGAAAANADTFAGQVSRLKVFMSELVEQIGYYVLPVLSKIAEFIVKDVVPAFQRIIERYGPALAEIFQKIADFIGEKVVPVMRDRLIPFIQQVAEFIGEKLVPVIRDVAIKVFDGLRKIFEVVSDKIEENRDKIGKLVEFFRTLASFIAEKVAPVLVTVLGKAFDIVAKAIGPVLDVVFTLMGAFADLGKFLVKVAGFVLDVIEGMVNGVIDGINLLIRAMNLIPGIDIDPIGNVTFTMPSLGSAPTPSKPSDGSSEAAEAARMGGLNPAGISFAGIDLGVTTTPSAGGGGGSKGGGADASLREGMVTILPSTEVFGASGGGGFGAAMGNEALLDGMTGGVVNVVVNTVSADANLPNLIVEALQTYNLTSGPIDVAIAV